MGLGLEGEGVRQEEHGRREGREAHEKRRGEELHLPIGAIQLGLGLGEASHLQHALHVFVPLDALDVGRHAVKLSWVTS